MEKYKEKINVWLRSHLIARLAEIFGEKCQLEKVGYTTTRPTGSFFLSDLFFLSVQFPGGEKRVLVKLHPQNPAIRSRINYNELFANETLFYERLAIADISAYPKCYLAEKDENLDNVLVLQDVRPYGFFISPKKVNVDLDYIISGLNSIARFHSNTYALKESDSDEFFRIVKDIKQNRYREKPINKEFKESVNARIKRVSRTLCSRNYDAEFTTKMVTLLEDCFTNIMLKSVKPVEPLATIIHGDCAINNLLFRKIRNERGEHLEAMLIDFALMMYSSPAIDILTLLYLTCKREDIKERSIDLLKIYHDCLTEHMKKRKIWDPVKYSFEAFWEDYKKRAAFGYIMATYFRAMMTEYEKNNDVLSSKIEVMEEINISGGGEAMSNWLVDLLIDAKEATFFDDYL